MRRLSLFLVMVVMATLAPVAGAQNAPESGFTVESVFVIEQPADQWSVWKFIGHSVVDESEERVGHFADVLVDKDGSVRTYVLKIFGFLGIGEKTVAIPAKMISWVGDNESGFRLKVSLTTAQLKNAPAFQKCKGC